MMHNTHRYAQNTHIYKHGYTDKDKHIHKDKDRDTYTYTHIGGLGQGPQAT